MKEASKSSPKQKKHKHVLRNNLYAMKLMWKLSKSYVIFTGIREFFDYFSWLFYSAVFMRYVIHAMETGKPYQEILLFLAGTVIVFGSITLFECYVMGRFWPMEQITINDKLSHMLYKKARNMDLACFEDSEFYDKYTLAMEKADTRLCDTVRVVWGSFFGAIAAVIAFIYMFQIDRLIGLFVIFPIVGNFIFGSLLSKIEFQRNKEMAPYNRMIAYINRVMYMREFSKEMRLSNVFHLMRKKYDGAIDGLSDTAKGYAGKGALWHWLKCMFTFCIIFEGVLMYAAYRALAGGTMPLSVLAVITSIMVSATWILIGFAESVGECIKNGFFFENFQSFMKHQPDIPEDYDGKDPGSVIESIEFRNVSFTYKEQEVLHNISMKFEGGKSYALVGHNGAGKTTIIKLLLRFYDPTQGEILLNGRNIKEYNLREYRSLFASAFQEQKIFSMSVMENVLMREGTKQDEETVRHALELAGVYDKVATLPKGMDTILTKEFDEKGALLSGGEFQKIVVARAFVQETPVKIFDEPSSALDPIAENELFEHILQNGVNRTMIFISHRLSSVQNAQWVYMLEQGCVIESGTHAMLMEQQGIYADMYLKQAMNYLAIDRA